MFSLNFFFNICLFCLFYFLGMHPYGKAAWPYTLEEEETCRRLESEWPDTNIFTLWEVLSLYRNLSVPLFKCNHTRFLYRFEQQVCWGKKKKKPSWRTLMHNFIMSWAHCERFITQKQSNYELFIFSLNTLAYIIFKGALCSLKLKYLNCYVNIFPSAGSAWCIQKCPTSVNQTQSC